MTTRSGTLIHQGNATLGVAGQDLGDAAQVIERIINKLLIKETISKPQQFHSGMDIRYHMDQVKEYLDTADVTETHQRVYILVHSLNEKCRLELQAMYDFGQNKNDYDWIVQQLEKLYGVRNCKISPLIRLIDIQQSVGKVFEITRLN